LAASRYGTLIAAVEANVRWSEKQIADIPAGKKALKERVVMLLGAAYELRTGRVRFLG